MERVHYVILSSSDLVEKISSASACEGIWEEAEKSDFKTVLPFLEELVFLTKQNLLFFQKN